MVVLGTLPCAAATATPFNLHGAAAPWPHTPLVLVRPYSLARPPPSPPAQRHAPVGPQHQAFPAAAGGCVGAPRLTAERGTAARRLPWPLLPRDRVCLRLHAVPMSVPAPMPFACLAMAIPRRCRPAATCHAVCTCDFAQQAVGVPLHAARRPTLGPMHGRAALPAMRSCAS
jgi:hypothetical protein